MDDLDDLQASEFVTDTEDQDSLDERIESEQRLRNQQLWASFQNAACCITKLYKDRAQSNISPWVPFQNAASNLTTLYKDCIESQKKFARMGYQAGRRKKMREISKLYKKHKMPTKTPVSGTQAQLQNFATAEDSAEYPTTLASSNISLIEDPTTQQQPGQQHNNVASILNVNQLNLGSDDSTSNSMQTQSSNQVPSQQQQQQLQSNNLQIILSNSEDDLYTFQQALAQPAVKGVKPSQNKRPCSNSSTGYLGSRSMENKTEEDRLLELNQFLSDEYYRHVGSRKRSCSTLGGGSSIKRVRE